MVSYFDGRTQALRARLDFDGSFLSGAASERHVLRFLMHGYRDVNMLSRCQLAILLQSHAQCWNRVHACRLDYTYGRHLEIARGAGAVLLRDIGSCDKTMRGSYDLIDTWYLACKNSLVYYLCVCRASSLVGYSNLSCVLQGS